MAHIRGHRDRHDHGPGDRPGDGLTYAARLERDRATRDSYFRSSPRSPVPPHARPDFQGLAWFPIDERYRLAGLRLEAYRGDEPVEFAIPTSDHQLRPACRAGVFTFRIGGTHCTLTAYLLGGSRADALFVPFLDATSGSETYGAGRYLDLEPEDDGTYVLDFNLAYHPLCVYSPDYSCPLTPAENRLSIRIEAGERLPVSA